MPIALPCINQTRLGAVTGQLIYKSRTCTGKDSKASREEKEDDYSFIKNTIKTSNTQTTCRQTL